MFRQHHANAIVRRITENGNVRFELWESWKDSRKAENQTASRWRLHNADQVRAAITLGKARGDVKMVKL